MLRLSVLRCPASVGSVFQVQNAARLKALIPVVVPLHAGLGQLYMQLQRQAALSQPTTEQQVCIVASMPLQIVCIQQCLRLTDSVNRSSTLMGQPPT